MRITLFRNIGKEEAIDLITSNEKGRKPNERRKAFFDRILPSLKGKSFTRPSPLKRGQ